MLVEAFDERFEEGIRNLPSCRPCLLNFQPFHSLLFEQLMLLAGSEPLLEDNVVVKLLGKLYRLLSYGCSAGFLVISAAAKVADLPIAAGRAEIDNEFGGVAFNLRDGGRVRRSAMRVACSLGGSHS